MEFKAREDIEAPIEFVFGEVTDFAGFERSIMRRGVEVTRLPGPELPSVGAKWQVNFRLRGKERSAVAELTRIETDGNLTIGVESNNISGFCDIELVALSLTRTRMNVVVSARPSSIPARILFQSMRFGKHRLTQRFKTAVLSFAEDIEAKYRANA